MMDVLSANWTTARLGDMCLKTEQTNPSARPDEAFRYVDVSAVSNQTYEIVDAQDLLGRDAPSRARKVIRADDVLFATVRPTLKRVAMVPPELDRQVCSTGYCVLRTKAEHLNPSFLYCYLLTESVTKQVDNLQKGATYPAINDGDLLGLELPLPPPPEQKAIALALLTLKGVVSSRRQELALERERKAALMEDLFTRGTQNVPRKSTELGQVPDNWSLVPLGSVFETQLGKMLSPKAKTGAEPKRYVRNANVQWGRVFCDDLFTMDFDTRESAKFRLRVGDVLVCEGGEVGRCALWRGEVSECYFQKAIHRLRPLDNGVNPAFFVHFMEYAFRLRNLYGIAGTQTTIAHLPQEKLVAMRILVPPLEEQKLVASVLDAVDTRIVALERETAVLEELFRAMLEELMTGRLSALPLVENVDGSRSVEA